MKVVPQTGQHVRDFEGQSGEGGTQRSQREDAEFRRDQTGVTDPIIFSASLIRTLRPLRTVFNFKALRSCDNSLSYKTPLAPNGQFVVFLRKF